MGDGTRKPRDTHIIASQRRTPRERTPRARGRRVSGARARGWRNSERGVRAVRHTSHHTASPRSLRRARGSDPDRYSDPIPAPSAKRTRLASHKRSSPRRTGHERRARGGGRGGRGGGRAPVTVVAVAAVPDEHPLGGRGSYFLVVQAPDPCVPHCHLYERFPTREGEAQFDRSSVAVAVCLLSGECERSVDERTNSHASVLHIMSNCVGVPRSRFRRMDGHAPTSLLVVRDEATFRGFTVTSPRCRSRKGGAASGGAPRADGRPTRGTRCAHARTDDMTSHIVDHTQHVSRVSRGALAAARAS